MRSKMRRENTAGQNGAPAVSRLQAIISISTSELTAYSIPNVSRRSYMSTHKTPLSRKASDHLPVKALIVQGGKTNGNLCYCG